jgi:hypothetical protein
MSEIPIDTRSVRGKWLSRIFLLVLICASLLGASVCWFVYFGGGDVGPSSDADLLVRGTASIESEQRFSRLRDIPPIKLPAANSPESDRLWAIITNAEQSKWDSELVEATLVRNEAALELFGQVITQGPLRVSAYDLSTGPHSYLERFARLGALAKLDALRLLHRGETEKAVRAAIELIQFGEAVSHEMGDKMDFLIGLSIKNMASDVVATMARSVVVSVDQLLVLAPFLAQLEPNVESWRDTIRVEYSLVSADIDRVVSGDISADALGDREYSTQQDAFSRLLLRCKYVFKPNETRLLASEACRRLISRAGQPFWTHEPFSSRLLGWKFTRNGVGQFYCAKWIDVLNGIERESAMQTFRARSVRTIVAIRRYWAKSRAVPDFLEQLVPDFIAAVPEDPFDGKALRYVPSRRILYSIGSDLKDSGGSSADRRGELHLEPTFAIDTFR